ncbi:phosphoadenylyl-sulfate reductase [Pleionea litopenaei]|uniref:Phosphoadenosine 5'-phosphosulfate reductase n=1 Tax=Pleionea litopenaei TaxID=3070815 RepID=A0AA51RU21_9GAMM|nr:phosphoadenylyl-sulfate reductase [Pleionea sp. HL-JVS1]WMS87631.1 phosphoadenylyl-sulfate reductase [Pleionea sp. HL-JVS1]
MSLKCLSTSVPNLAVSDFDFVEANQNLAAMSAQQRVEWSLRNLPGTHVLTSSFGAQSAVSLHLFQQVAPGIPVVLIDTGYLFPETYQFIDRLTNQLSLNLKVYRSALSPAWQEARFGQLWTQGLEGIEQYNQMNKVEPLEHALEELGASTWYAGLRREQSSSRQSIEFIRPQKQRFKMHPIADWSNRDMHFYLKEQGLDYHPLWEKGYVSIGDTHTTRPITADMTEEETRFFGLKRECGIHEI